MVGQYHVIVNHTKSECFWPDVLGCGLKLSEFCGERIIAAALTLLLARDSIDDGVGDFKHSPIAGRWAGDRIGIYGDYSETNENYAAALNDAYLHITLAVVEAIYASVDKTLIPMDEYELQSRYLSFESMRSLNKYEKQERLAEELAKGDNIRLLLENN